jgi:hypothetical protein
MKLRAGVSNGTSQFSKCWEAVSVLYGNEPSANTKCGEYLEELREYQIP